MRIYNIRSEYFLNDNGKYLIYKTYFIALSSDSINVKLINKIKTKTLRLLLVIK
jgi:hypothetical protein